MPLSVCGCVVVVLRVLRCDCSQVGGGVAAHMAHEAEGCQGPAHQKCNCTQGRACHLVPRRCMAQGRLESRGWEPTHTHTHGSTTVSYTLVTHHVHVHGGKGLAPLTTLAGCVHAQTTFLYHNTCCGKLANWQNMLLTRHRARPAAPSSSSGQLSRSHLAGSCGRKTQPAREAKLQEPLVCHAAWLAVQWRITTSNKHT